MLDHIKLIVLSNVMINYGNAMYNYILYFKCMNALMNNKSLYVTQAVKPLTQHVSSGKLLIISLNI